MDLTDLRAELRARGFEYEDDDDRIDRWINQSQAELCELMSWPFLEDDATGNSPLTIADLRAVLSVTDTTNRCSLAPMDVRELRRIDPTLDCTGAPQAWYLDGTAVKVWPATSVALDVHYLKVPADLVATSDEPVVPERFQGIIVDGAVCKAQKDDDDYDAMQVTRAEWQRQVDAMVSSLMNRALDRPQFIMITEPRDY